MRACTRCDEIKPDDEFRRIGQGRRHTWCRPCESEASSQRYARARSAMTPVFDCRVTADNIDHVLTHHGARFGDETTAVLTAARDLLRIEAAALAKGVA